MSYLAILFSVAARNLTLPDAGTSCGGPSLVAAEAVARAVAVMFVVAATVVVSMHISTSSQVVGGRERGLAAD